MVDKHCGLYFQEYNNNASSTLTEFILPHVSQDSCENLRSDVATFIFASIKTTKRMSSQHLVFMCIYKLFIDLITE